MENLRVLVTGAGGPAGIAVIRSLQKHSDIDIFAADMDTWASGLYLVPSKYRRILPAGASDDFLPVLQASVDSDSIDVVISTVDDELRALAEHEDSLGHAVLAAPPGEALKTCLDKLLLIQHCESTGYTPQTAAIGDAADAMSWDFPVIVKPRNGSGSRGVHLVETPKELSAVRHQQELIVQENLPGDEYSVDLVADKNSRVLSAVPRFRARVDSGVAVAGKTIIDDELITIASEIASKLGIIGVANVQLRRDTNGHPKLLEVNPRFSGGTPLTIAAGLDTPVAVVDIFTNKEPQVPATFREIANVRYLEDVFLDVNDMKDK